MNILVFSQNAWDDTNSFGNTVSNFFEGWQDDSFCHFYIRRQIPANQVAKTYYCLPVGTVLRKLLGRSHAPCCFRWEDIPRLEADTRKESEREKNRIQKLRQKKHLFTHLAYEALWESGIWLDSEFKQFIRENPPDIFFAFAANAFLLSPLIRFLKANTKAKIVLFIADDVYGQYEQYRFLRGKTLKKRFRDCMERADRLYAISDAMKTRYTDLFHKEIHLLRKGCELSAPLRETCNAPLRLVYAGNLLYGRVETLMRIADILARINEKQPLALLELYSPTALSEKEEAHFRQTKSVLLMGQRPYEEIKRIQNEADVVLHVESFDPAQIALTKYSFSTKIIDCIQSGSAILSVVPEESASVSYLRRIDGVALITNEDELEARLQSLIDRKNELPAKALAIRAAAKRDHDIHTVRKTLKQELQALLEQE